MYAELLRLYQVSRRAVECQENRRRARLNERHQTEGQTEEWQEALSTEWVMESSSARWQTERRFERHCLPRSPTRSLSPRDSLLNFYWMWNVKRRGTGTLSFFSVFFPSPLSVRGWVCHATGAQPQTVNADKINFLMLIPVGTEHTEGKRGALQFCVKLGVCPLHLCD